MKKIIVFFLIHCVFDAVTSADLFGCKQFKIYDSDTNEDFFPCQIEKCQCFSSNIKRDDSYKCYGRKGNLTCTFYPIEDPEEEIPAGYENQPGNCLKVKYDTDNHYIVLIPIKCNPNDSEGNTEIIVKALSAFCLFLTIAVHLILPDFQQRHFKFCTFSFICLGITLILLCIESKLHDYRNSCLIVGQAGYYFAMATFLWLFVINCNLWMNFKSIGQKEFSMLKSHIFVWGVAGTLYLITFLVEKFNSAQMDSGSMYTTWKPGFGEYSCWIKICHESGLIFYYGPIAVLLLLNTILTISSGWHLYMQVRNNNKILKDSRRKAAKQNDVNFFMFLRIFVTAGLIWIIEIFIYVNRLYLNIPKLEWLTYIPTSQGIMIFISTVLRKEVLKPLYSRFSDARRRLI